LVNLSLHQMAAAIEMNGAARLRVVDPKLWILDIRGRCAPSAARFAHCRTDKGRHDRPLACQSGLLRGPARGGTLAQQEVLYLAKPVGRLEARKLREALDMRLVGCRLERVCCESWEDSL
jgi:hypothetical protein